MYGSRTNVLISVAAITAAEISAGAITTAKIATNAVTANEIAALTITGSKIAANTITGGRLAIYADSNASNDGSTYNDNGGIVSVEAGPSGGVALLTALGIADKEYLTPTYFPGYSYQAPRWRTTDTKPAPTGSVWQRLPLGAVREHQNSNEYDLNSL